MGTSRFPSSRTSIGAWVKQWWALGGVGTLVVCVATFVLLAGRHTREPTASATPHRGWILHEKYETTVVPYAGAGHFQRQLTERWELNSDSCARRTIQRVFFWTQTVETAQESNPSTSWAYSPRDNTLYWQRPGDCTPFVDRAAEIKSRYRERLLKLIGRVTVDGRRALRLKDTQISQTVTVDADTYVPLVVRFQGMPLKQRGSSGGACSFQLSPQFPPTVGTRRTVVYEYLPPTEQNRKLLDIQAQHPDAKVAPATQMSRNFRDAVAPASCGNSPTP